jgi:hypothetical protein
MVDMLHGVHKHFSLVPLFALSTHVYAAATHRSLGAAVLYAESLQNQAQTDLFVESILRTAAF